MFCIKCGKEYKDGSLFCRYCGTPTDDGGAPESTAVETVAADKPEPTTTAEKPVFAISKSVEPDVTAPEEARPIIAVDESKAGTISALRDEQAQALLLCKSCGAEMPDGAEFCGVCGTSLNKTAAKPFAVMPMSAAEKTPPKATRNMTKLTALDYLIMFSGFLAAVILISFLEGLSISTSTGWKYCPIIPLICMVLAGGIGVFMLVAKKHVVKNLFGACLNAVFLFSLTAVLYGLFRFVKNEDEFYWQSVYLAELGLGGTGLSTYFIVKARESELEPKKWLKPVYMLSWSVLLFDCIFHFLYLRGNMNRSLGLTPSLLIGIIAGVGIGIVIGGLILSKIDPKSRTA